jgi:hypothetical protein
MSSANAGDDQSHHDDQNPGGDSSMKTFSKFITSAVVNNHVVIDAIGVLSKECFQQWSKGRSDGSVGLEEKFQRSITAHLTAGLSGNNLLAYGNLTDGLADGRRPFGADEEEALLRVMRSKRPWFVQDATRD